MEKSKILYAEDDKTIAFLLQDGLEPYYEIEHYGDGKSALEAFNCKNFDICLLDIMMPEMNGFDLAEKIRQQNSEIPIIFISAKALKEDRIKGLKIGADDYLVKPFSIEELILKIEIFLKRSKKTQPLSPKYKVAKYDFDPQNYTLQNSGSLITLTQRESELLLYFIRHKNTVLKRQDILKAIWGDDDYFMGRSLDVFISRLRKVFADEENISIENLHGIGFRFSEK
ncbi:MULTISPECIES: response regulator transcription factor [Chryseobacterium]|jgi:DNA-binding response OmpR family regulator|uniref:Two-component system response regulator n=1 Tax=Chryseobacterium aquaticum subsp. greenlandense TaxID=345663 RepID=A0A101CCU2_9FLAO|nr:MULTISPECIES: response regulator transcription factor [Chryseobacterium]KNB63238.1 transcriptional regulator [Chryseobacterium sp. Hurlbut01]KUJ53868.1 two-component system response regulator [Chryseobacterium aquaticum subsp. greenlandense]